MSVNRSMLLCMGICLALVVFGLQVALAGFNQDVQPARPVYLFHLDVAGPGGVQVDLLGQSWTLTWPPDGAALPAITGQMKKEWQWRVIVEDVHKYGQQVNAKIIDSAHRLDRYL